MSASRQDDFVAGDMIVSSENEEVVYFHLVREAGILLTGSDMFSYNTVHACEVCSALVLYELVMEHADWHEKSTR